MKQEALQRIKHFCAYQERSHQEVRSKLLELKIYGLELENIMTILIDENYLNEERFACSIARGRFYLKNWGRIKIRQLLKQHDVSEYCIRKAMQEIDGSDYEKTIQRLIEKKYALLQSEKNQFVLFKKLNQYLLQKGFESDVIQDLIKIYLKENQYA